MYISSFSFKQETLEGNILALSTVESALDNNTMFTYEDLSVANGVITVDLFDCSIEDTDNLVQFAMQLDAIMVAINF